METIIVVSFAILIALVAFSQFDIFKNDSKNEKLIFRYMIFSFSLAVSALLLVAMMISYGNTYCYLFYALDKFVKVVMMCEVVRLTEDMVDVEKRYISLFVSIMTYGAILLFFVDTFVMSNNLTKGTFGVYYNQIEAWHQILYFLYYMSYIIMLCTFVVLKSAVVIRKRENKELQYLFFIYLASALGFVGEQFIICYSSTYIPSAVIFNLIAVVLMRKFLNYHDSIVVKPDIFMKELDEGRTDVAFVLNDQMKIIYQNKRAEVFGKIVNDSFLDRKISDVFEFSDKESVEMIAKPDAVPFGVTAKYNKNNHNVNMVIQHRLDPYGEILATGVFVYNIEDSVKTRNFVPDEQKFEDDSQIVQNALSVTKGAKALIVDEDIIFLNVFSRLLEKYELVVTKAMGGQEAITMISDIKYDIVFVSYEMTRMSGDEIVKRIRKLPGNYYQQLPIVFVTQQDINEVFEKFIEVGFNDYILKPVATRALSLVLTRWLWKRFDSEDSEGEVVDSIFSPQYFELSNLANDASELMKHQKYDRLKYIVNGIKHICVILKLYELADLSAEIDEAIMLDDIEKVEQLTKRLINGAREASTL